MEMGMNSGKWIKYTWIGKQMQNTKTEKFNSQVDIRISWSADELGKHMGYCTLPDMLLKVSLSRWSWGFGRLFPMKTQLLKSFGVVGASPERKEKCIF